VGVTAAAGDHGDAHTAQKRVSPFFLRWASGGVPGGKRPPDATRPYGSQIDSGDE
jgi:hypothetical protein